MSQSALLSSMDDLSADLFGAMVDTFDAADCLKRAHDALHASDPVETVSRLHSAIAALSDVLKRCEAAAVPAGRLADYVSDY